MQNSIVLYVVGAIVIVAAGAGIWMYSGKTNSMETSIGDTNTQIQRTSLKGLLADARPQKCTFTMSSANSNSSGTVYISNGKMRGDFVSNAAGHTQSSHMIVEGGASYMWSDEMAQGFKMSFDAMSNTSMNSQEQGTVDPNADTDYSCNPWVADESVFAVPTNITFQDMSAIAPPGAAGASGGTSVSGSAEQCAACDQASNEGTRAQCKAALQCK
ncbi:hypothetical protein H7X87_01770 [Acetobacteraceae bacterium]|nr:hypothetical protein [Candidatus Parcubacteria bacterium]